MQLPLRLVVFVDLSISTVMAIIGAAGAAAGSVAATRAISNAGPMAVSGTMSATLSMAVSMPRTVSMIGRVPTARITGAARVRLVGRTRAIP
ncbi:MAG TPA: hypothetical protein VGW37_10110 [Terriglobia bacterium]|nr:hypothetical protein [Terriglobia bacterium]